MPAPKKYTCNELAESIGCDVRTLKSIVTALGYVPSGKRRGADLYSLSAPHLAKVKEAVKNRAGGSKQSELPLDLKEAKLAEEVEYLKLKNRKLRDEATPNRIMAEILSGLTTFVSSLLTQKLEKEWPVQVAGLEPGEIRPVAKKLNDEIRAKFYSELEKWEQYLEAESDKNIE
jgi:hypothetical protein